MAGNKGAKNVQKRVISGIVLALAAAGSALAQSADASKFYKLDYVVKEVEGGKVVNSRAFSTMLPVSLPGREKERSSIRAGGKVPVTTGNSTQFYDIGVNLDTMELRVGPGEVSMYITADVSTIAQEGLGTMPMTRQNRWQGSVVVPLKKPTVVFASDDVSSKRQLQLELTATPVAPAK
jgi:hypothetical protein